jgi:hypothetical protein
MWTKQRIDITLTDDKENTFRVAARLARKKHSSLVLEASNDGKVSVQEIYAIRSFRFSRLVPSNMKFVKISVSIIILSYLLWLEN